MTGNRERVTAQKATTVFRVQCNNFEDHSSYAGRSSMTEGIPQLFSRERCSGPLLWPGSEELAFPAPNSLMRVKPKKSSQDFESALIAGEKHAAVGRDSMQLTYLCSRSSAHSISLCFPCCRPFARRAAHASVLFTLPRSACSRGYSGKQRVRLLLKRPEMRSFRGRVCGRR